MDRMINGAKKYSCSKIFFNKFFVFNIRKTENHQKTISFINNVILIYYLFKVDVITKNKSLNFKFIYEIIRYKYKLFVYVTLFMILFK